jgi:hypothetical protein
LRSLGSVLSQAEWFKFATKWVNGAFLGVVVVVELFTKIVTQVDGDRAMMWFYFMKVSTLLVGGGVEPNMVEVLITSCRVDQQDVSFESFVEAVFLLCDNEGNDSEEG